MPDKAVTIISDLTEQVKQWIPYLWVLSLSALGGAVNFIHKVRTKQVSRFSITELLGELITSAFAGMLTYFFCQAVDLNQWVTAAFIGVAGHMGSRLIFKLEKLLEKKLGV